MKYYILILFVFSLFNVSSENINLQEKNIAKNKCQYLKRFLMINRKVNKSSSKTDKLFGGISINIDEFIIDSIGLNDKQINLLESLDSNNKYSTKNKIDGYLMLNCKCYRELMNDSR